MSGRRRKSFRDWLRKIEPYRLARFTPPGIYLAFHDRAARQSNRVLRIKGAKHHQRDRQEHVLGEALALEWADVEFEHRRIVIRQSKSGEGRKIPLRSALADELIRWKPHSRGSRWVFPARYDVAQPMQSIRKGWSRLCAKAVVSLLRPHDLRHNFTSQLQAAGVSDSIIMSITGHKTHVMLHRYSHANDEHKRKALEALPDHQVNLSGDVVSIRRMKT